MRARRKGPLHSAASRTLAATHSSKDMGDPPVGVVEGSLLSTVPLCFTAAFEAGGQEVGEVGEAIGA